MRFDLVLPKFKLLSGAERLILELGQALRAKGHAVRLVCHAMDESCRALAAGLEVVETGTRLDWTGNHYLDSIASYALGFRLRRALDPAADAVCLFGPALVVALAPRRGCHRLFYFCYEPPRAASVDRRDVLERVGFARWALRPALALYRPVDRLLVGRTDAVLVSGPFAQDLITAEYGRASRVITPGVVPPAEPIARESVRAALELPSEARVAVTVNFLHPRKRIDLLLRAWTRVEETLPAAVLLVIGDGPERERLQGLAATLGLGRVRFLGFVPDAELPRCYAAADVLVHTARLETFGLTILEAGAQAVPSVVVDEGGPRITVRQGESGLRVAAEEAALAMGITRLLSEPETARRMGERAREIVRRDYRWDRGAEDFLEAVRLTPPPLVSKRRPA